MGDRRGWNAEKLKKGPGIDGLVKPPVVKVYTKDSGVLSFFPDDLTLSAGSLFIEDIF